MNRIPMCRCVAAPRTRAGAVCLGLAGVLGLVASAQAIEIETDNPDLSVRWDNSIRYNLGVRAQGMNPEAYNTLNYDESDSRFGRGDVVTNRVDLFSELDVVWKRRFGARISAAGWYDNAYRNSGISTNPAFTVPGLGSLSQSIPGGRDSAFTKRWNKGVSGEILDAFLFAGGDVAGIPMDVRVGQHNVYWGESLFSFVHGVSYSQSPVDVRKAFTNPGVQAKELFLPLNQISGQMQLPGNVTLGGQYMLDWKPSRIPDAGTYLGLTDFLTAGGGTYVINPAQAAAAGGVFTPVTFDGALREPSKKRGDWGLRSSWRPDWLDGTVGAYYREYTDKFPLIVSGGFQPGLPVPTNVGFSYLEGAKLYGVSLSKDVGGVSVGAELTMRKNGGLLMNGAATVGTEPRGNTLHALLNAVYVIPRNPLFDLGSLTAELSYSQLRKVTANPGSFNSVDYACLDGNGASTRDMWDACATKSSVGLAVQFVPTWNQVFPGVDLSVPMFYQAGLRGNSPVLFGGYKGNDTYSFGVAADLYGKYNVALSYNGFRTKYKTTPSPVNGQPSIGSVNGIGYIADRDFVSLTFKTSF